MYKTNDLYLTAYLIAQGFMLESHVRVNGRIMFQITDKNGLDEIIREYYSGTGKVSGLQLFNALKNLKNLLYLNMDNYGKLITNNHGATK